MGPDAEGRAQWKREGASRPRRRGRTVCASRKDQPSDNNEAFDWLVVPMRVEGDSVVGGAAAQHHQPESMFIPRRAEGYRGDDALRIVEEGQGTVWRSLLGAPPLLVELTEAEPNSSSTGTAEGALTETAGEGGTQSCEGGTQSMSTATDQLSSSPSTMDTSEEGVGHPEIGGGDGMCRESSRWALRRGAPREAAERGQRGVKTVEDLASHKTTLVFFESGALKQDEALENAGEDVECRVVGANVAARADG